VSLPPSSPESAPEASEQPRHPRRRLAEALGLGLGPALFLLFSRGSGLWDPFELQASELARRVALQVFGARSLVVVGAENSLPTLGDVGRMELGTTSIALSFRLFGLSEGAARLPMALWASVGLWALHTLLRRLSSLRTATFGALILTATPLYFVHARLLLGDIVPMAASLLAFAGLGLALLGPDPDDAPARSPARAAALAVGVVGLVAGHFSRGALLGVGVPLVSVGVVGLLAPGLSTARRRLAGGAVVLGVVVTVFTVRALVRAAPGPIDPWLGSAVLAAGRRYLPFDATLSALGYGLFPWSAFLPFALVHLFFAPPSTLTAVSAGDARLRALVAAGLVFGGAAHTLLAPTVGSLPFVFVGLAAAACAIALDDLAQSGRPSRAVAAGTALLLALLVLDLRRFPEKGIVVCGLRQAAFPHSFERAATAYVALTATVFALGIVGFSLDPDGPPAPREGTRPASFVETISVLPEARAWLLELSSAMNGNVAFVAIMAEAALVGVAAVVLLGDLTTLLSPPKLSATGRLLALSAWIVLPTALAATFFVVGSGRRAIAWLLSRAGVSRAVAILFAGVLGSGALFGGYFPTLAGQLSPRALFLKYGQIARPGEPLGLLGVSPRSAAYYVPKSTGMPTPTTFDDTASAFSWLVGGAAGAPDERRFLAVRADRFAPLNSLFREHAGDLRGVLPDHNLPVLDGRSSELLLLSNQLRADQGETNANPLQRWVTTSPGPIAHPVAANFAGEVRLLGWNLVEAGTEAPLQSLRPGQAAALRLVLEVVQRPSTEWDSFVHVDGYGRRFAGDHKPLEGMYPMRLWQPGDFIVETLPILLDPSFSPGTYRLFAGFFVGDDRMPVHEGRHRENRVELGPIPVSK
jgi:hypothetical protein